MTYPSATRPIVRGVGDLGDQCGYDANGNICFRPQFASSGGIELGGDLWKNLIDSETITIDQFAGDTLQQTMADVLPYRIAADKLLTIQLPSAILEYTTPVFFRHPQAPQILVTGQQLTTLAPSGVVTCVSTGVSTVDGATLGAGVHDVTFAFNTDPGLDVGDVLRVTATGGTAGFRQLLGTWPVTAVPSALELTVRNSSKNTTIEAIDTLTGASIKKYNTVLKFSVLSVATAQMTAANVGITDNAAAFEIFDSGFTLWRMAIIWDQLDASTKKMGIGLRGGQSLRASKEMGIHGFNTTGSNGIWAQYKAFVNANEMSISDCNEQGFAAHYGSIVLADDCRVTGCAGGGKARSGKSLIKGSSTSVFAGNTIGLDAEDDSAIIAPGAKCEYNATYNGKGDRRSFLDLKAAAMTVAGTSGLLLQNESAAYIESAVIGGGTNSIDMRSGSAISDGGSAPTLTGVLKVVDTCRYNGRIMSDISAVASDADFTLTALTSAPITRHTGVLTADRAVTLAGGYEGAEFDIVRTGGGAFNLNVGTGPLKGLATDTWAKFRHNGTAWALAAYGAL